MTFPLTRLRRLRSSKSIRKFTQENRLAIHDFVMPIFVKEGIKSKSAISSMPGQYQHSVTSAVNEARKCYDMGIPAIILFGIPSKKNSSASESYKIKGVIQQCIKKIKSKAPKLVIISDVCLCEYTSHGHCGHIEGDKIQNDLTIKTLSKIALSHAESGADIIAPSDMMDGRIQQVRQDLDKNGFEDTILLSYAAKYASAFYGPFRDAAESAPKFGDRKSYQMNPANKLESLREVEHDLREGADLILIKPALSYLDIIHDVKNKFLVPTGAYNVSGEYSLVKAAALKGWVDEKQVVTEMLLSIKRAGADFIITYWAKDMVKWLKK